MNDYLLSILLGAIEGLTEFLPVSSTAHLRIAEALFQIDLGNGFWKMYTVVIQLGAILALTAFFWRRILKFLGTFPRGARGDRTVLTHPLSLVLIAFIVTAIPAFLLSKLIGKNLENLHVMAFALLIGGIVMWLVDSLFVRPKIQQMDERGGGKVIRAHVPLSEMFGYATTVRSMSQGRASYTMQFLAYEPAPKNVAEAVIAKNAGNTQRI